MAFGKLKVYWRGTKSKVSGKWD